MASDHPATSEPIEGSPQTFHPARLPAGSTPVLGLGVANENASERAGRQPSASPQREFLAGVFERARITQEAMNIVAPVFPGAQIIWIGESSNEADI